MREMLFRSFVLCVAVVAAVWGSQYIQGAEGAASSEEEPAPKPVLDTYQLMDYIIEPVFDDLSEALDEEPKSRGTWRDIRNWAYALAEGSNLMMFRNDMDYNAAKEWQEMSVKSRETSAALGEIAVESDYAKAKEHFNAMVQACNQCHERFEPEIAPDLKTK